jgi:serine/threonine protein kinase
MSYPNSYVVCNLIQCQANILVDRSGHLRIADFGLSIILAEAEHDIFNSSCPGNVRWMPPEALRDEDEDEDEDQDEDEGEDKDKKPTKAWDIYSYGCVVLQVCRIVNT